MAVDSIDSSTESKCYRVKDAMDCLVQENSESVTLICPPAVDVGLARRILEPLAEELGKKAVVLIGEGVDVCEINEILEEWLVRNRCSWADTPLLAYYHDFEWGNMPTSDSKWFEFVTLEIFQAGLSWKTILRKRLEFRKAFLNFDINGVSQFTEQDIEDLLQNPGIVRNKKKLLVSVENAKIALNLLSSYGSLDTFFRTVCLGAPEHKIISTLCETFRFVGPTTAQSIANATGLIPPLHDESCYLAQ